MLTLDELPEIKDSHLHVYNKVLKGWTQEQHLIYFCYKCIDLEHAFIRILLHCFFHYLGITLKHRSTKYECHIHM